MATATRVTVIDGDGHIMENRGRHIELLEEPYRGFRSVTIESSALVPLDGIDRNLGMRLNKGSARRCCMAPPHASTDWTAKYPSG